MKKLISCILIFCTLFLMSGCNKKQASDLIIPLLTYNAENESIQLCEWDIASNVITALPREYISITDIAAHLYEIGWDGENLIVIPYGIVLSGIQKVNEEISIKAEQYYDDVVTKKWSVTKSAIDILQVENDEERYQLDITMLHEEYECAGIVEKNNELALLMVNHVLGEALIYYFDLDKQEGSVYPIDGFDSMVNSQLEIEKTAIEHGYGFFFTDGYKVYYIDVESRTAQNIFSKNVLAESYIEVDDKNSMILDSCWIAAIGAYEESLIINLQNDENDKFLCCQLLSTDTYVLYDYTKSGRDFILPDLE